MSTKHKIIKILSFCHGSLIIKTKEQVIPEILYYCIKKQISVQVISLIKNTVVDKTKDVIVFVDFHNANVDRKAYAIELMLKQPKGKVIVDFNLSSIPQPILDQIYIYNI